MTNFWCTPIGLLNLAVSRLRVHNHFFPILFSQNIKIKLYPVKVLSQNDICKQPYLKEEKQDNCQDTCKNLNNYWHFPDGCNFFVLYLYTSWKQRTSKTAGQTWKTINRPNLVHGHFWGTIWHLSQNSNKSTIQHTSSIQNYLILAIIRIFNPNILIH